MLSIYEVIHCPSDRGPDAITEIRTENSQRNHMEIEARFGQLRDFERKGLKDFETKGFSVGTTSIRRRLRVQGGSKALKPIGFQRSVEKVMGTHMQASMTSLRVSTVCRMIPAWTK